MPTPLERLLAHRPLDEAGARLLRARMRRRRLGAVIHAGVVMGLVVFAATWSVVSLVVVIGNSLSHSALATAIVFGLLSGFGSALASAATVTTQDQALGAALRPLDALACEQLQLAMAARPQTAALWQEWIAGGAPMRQAEAALVAAYVVALASPGAERS